MTAGFILAKMLRGSGPLIVLSNHLGLPSYSRRVSGFGDALAKYAPDREIAEIVEAATIPGNRSGF